MAYGLSCARSVMASTSDGQAPATCSFDDSRQRALWRGRVVDLTHSEYRVAQLLVERSGHDTGYREIYDLLHGKGFRAGAGDEGYRANVRALIKRIRKKFREADPGFDQIVNRPGYGYRWTNSG
ncbi:MAG: helix-turn-helix domain-containing protein [Alphaproteobacteria bacterium]|nr:helix-turn-helix domain-containing protein [Alphaproteobacteria bacterium]